MPKIRTFSALGLACIFSVAALAQVPQPVAPAPAPGSVLAAQAEAAKAEPPTEAEGVVDAAIKMLSGLKSVSADIVQDVDMLEQKFQITGRYLRAPDRKVSLKLVVDHGLADVEKGIMYQVCDGQVLWDFTQIFESMSCRKTDVGQVYEKLKSPELDDKIRDAVNTQLGFAGPEALLVGLRRAVRFDQKSEETLDGVPVWVVRGDWKSREGLFGVNQQPLPPTAPLPAYVPSVVIAYIGKDDGWPYKLRLVGKRPSAVMDTRKIGPDGRRVGAQSTIQELKPTTIELAYKNVKFNPDLKADEFFFQPPPTVKPEDNTPLLVQGLDREIQMRAAQKKSDAAKGEETLLKEAIPIPKPGEAPAPLTTPPGAAAPAPTPR